MGLGSRAIACRFVMENTVSWLVDISRRQKSRDNKSDGVVCCPFSILYDDDDDLKIKRKH